MWKIVENILNGKDIRESLWNETSVDDDISSVQMELRELGFLYGDSQENFMHCKDTGFSGNKIYAVVSSLGVNAEDPEDGLLRVELSINSYPEETEMEDGFRFSCLIPREQAHVCKAYLQRLLRRVRNSEAYIEHLKPIKTKIKDRNIGVGVIIFNGDNILVGTRTDGKGLCGPGGGVHIGEEIYDAAVRETKEEFGITPLELEPIGKVDIDGHKPSYIFKTSSYDGEIKTDDKEMVDPCWVKVDDLIFGDVPLFEPFKQSLDLIL